MTDENHNTPPTPKRLKFPANDFDQAIPDLLLTTEPPAKWSAINAIRHLNRAWTIKELDQDMSALRALTAEEEAAKAIILTLKRLGYPSATQLNENSHVHKFAITPFIQEIINQRHLISPLYQRLTLRLDETTRHLELVGHPHPPLDDKEITSEPPLHLLIKKGGKYADLGGAREHLADPNEAARITTLLKNRASFRTKLLYAPHNGLHELASPINDVLTNAQNTTLRLLKVFLLIDPYDQHQFLVTQALAGFLHLLQRTAPDLDDLFKNDWPTHLSKLFNP
jgi:hypothetical protein